jgi:hypothetical protein
MKFNKWTLGLAAVGVVSLASAVRADEAKMSALQTALSSTTISGYVSASFNWEAVGGHQYVVNDPYFYGSSPAANIPYQGPRYNKQDGFNLDVVKISIAKPQDESQWASGYQVDLLFGPDAVGYNTSVNSEGWTDFGIKQAYIALRTPVGNGIDWKVGVFDSIIGYEVFDAGSNPNYTRSWGYAIEPTEFTGILATYRVSDMISFSAGIANTLESGINARAWNYDQNHGYQNRDWNKAFMGSVTFTAPSSWGWAAGSSFYAGIVYGFNGDSQYNAYYYSSPSGHDNGFYANGNQVNYYAGVTLNTPCKQLTVGAAFDYAHNFAGGFSGMHYPYWFGDTEQNVLVAGLYATYKATDKLSLNVRGEYLYGEENSMGHGDRGLTHPVLYSYNHTPSADAIELTGTVEYDLWANVISRLEVRWDHLDGCHDSRSGTTYYVPFGDVDSHLNRVNNQDSVGFYANIIYKF